MSWTPDEYVYDYSASNYDANDGIYISETNAVNKPKPCARPPVQPYARPPVQPYARPAQPYARPAPYAPPYPPPYAVYQPPMAYSAYPPPYASMPVQYAPMNVGGGCAGSCGGGCGSGIDTFVGRRGCKKKSDCYDECDSRTNYFAPETLQLVKIFIMIIVVILLATSLTVAFRLYREIHKSIKMGLALLSTIANSTAK